MEKNLTDMNRTVVGVFYDTYQAELAMAELGQTGFREDQIDFMMSEASTVTGSYSAGGEPVLRSHEFGRAVIRVRAEERSHEVEEILRRHEASDVRFSEGTEVIDEGEIPTRELIGNETWSEASPVYRRRWQQRYGAAGRRWEDYEPAYRYGWERSQATDHHGRSWSEVEPEFRSGWERGHHLSPWERIVDAVRDAWENVTGHQDRQDRAA